MKFLDKIPDSVLVVLTVVFALGVGYAVGNNHPGETLVPTIKGQPSDLPAWACYEITNLRLDQVELLRQQQVLLGNPAPVVNYLQRPREICG